MTDLYTVALINHSWYWVPTHFMYVPEIRNTLATKNLLEDTDGLLRPLSYQ